MVRTQELLTAEGLTDIPLWVKSGFKRQMKMLITRPLGYHIIVLMGVTNTLLLQGLSPPFIIRAVKRLALGS